jgi:hypothetical protein
MKTSWLWRSREPAKSPPNPAYPHGLAIDVSRGLRSCEARLDYPAPGVGTWIVTCETCGSNLAVTAAGRPDDPTTVRIPCHKRADA